MSMRRSVVRFTLICGAAAAAGFGSVEAEDETLVRRQPEGSKINLFPLTNSVRPDKARLRVRGVAMLASSFVSLFFDIFLYITPCMLTMLRDLLAPGFGTCGSDLQDNYIAAHIDFKARICFHIKGNFKPKGEYLHRKMAKIRLIIPTSVSFSPHRWSVSGRTDPQTHAVASVS